MAGFCATGLFEFIQEQIDTCITCMEAKMVLKGMSTITQNMKRFYGPGNFITNITHLNLMKIVSIDKAGPFYLDDGNRGHDKTYILTCVELLTYKCHLIPLPRIDTLHFVFGARYCEEHSVQFALVGHV